MPSSPTRRRFLAGLLGVTTIGLSGALTSCRGDVGGLGVSATLPPRDPDLNLVITALAYTDQLINAYTDALAAAPTADPLQARLTGFLAEHSRHRDALLEWSPEDGSELPEVATPDPSASPTGRPATTSDLLAMETTAAKVRSDLALTASDLLARLLASVSACDAVHAALLSTP